MKNGWMRVAERAGVLPVGDLVEADLERGEDEQDQPDLGVGARRRVVVLLRAVDMGVAMRLVLT